MKDHSDPKRSPGVFQIAFNVCLQVGSAGLTFTGFGIPLQLVARLALALVAVLSELNALLLAAPLVNTAGTDGWSQGSIKGTHVNNLGNLFPILST